ncbi:MAG: thiamine pyrophosphate-dependent dehydrogenase E1 component subunit alpha [Pirellulales bacterium]|nr:thiamine pyrophosphate-dependent dehydrogenase E1 component subunit alpha [Pirellulales bacterium]
MALVDAEREELLEILSRDRLLAMYEQMRTIRVFEDTLHTLFASGEIPGFVHLYAGEEAVAVGVIGALKPDDYVSSTHRGHGHCLAKGVELNSMLAEIYGRATGVCKGKGGSMHIADVSRGMLGANGIVGAGMPLAAGAALAAKLRRSGQVSVCFFGDGGSNQGTLHEAINLAAIWDLPCLFVCENNGYAEATSPRYSTKVKHIADRAAAYNIPGVVVDGQDVVEVYLAARQAVERARSGAGPTLIEAKTYRFYGHFEGDAMKYRTAEEVGQFRRRDPLKIFAEEIAPQAEISSQEMQEIDAAVDRQMQAAIEFARSSPLPSPEDCLTDVYVNY